MFQIKEIVKTSGEGRTVNWGECYGTVVNISDTSVFVIWHETAFEDEMSFDEVISTGEFAE